MFLVLALGNSVGLGERSLLVGRDFGVCSLCRMEGSRYLSCSKWLKSCPSSCLMFSAVARGDQT